MQCERPADMGRDPVRDQAEEAADPQVGHDDHHAEQERDGVEIDRTVSLLRSQHADAQHEAATEQRRAGAIDAINGNLADRDDRVSRDEDCHRCNQSEVGHRDCFPQPGQLPSLRSNMRPIFVGRWRQTPKRPPHIFAVNCSVRVSHD